MKWDDLRPGDVLWNDDGDPCWVVVRKDGQRVQLLSLILGDHVNEVDLERQEITGERLGDGDMEAGWRWFVATEGRCSGVT